VEKTGCRRRSFTAKPKQSRAGTPRTPPLNRASTMGNKSFHPKRIYRLPLIQFHSWLRPEESHQDEQIGRSNLFGIRDRASRWLASVLTPTTGAPLLVIRVNRQLHHLLLFDTSGTLLGQVNSNPFPPWPTIFTSLSLYVSISSLQCYCLYNSMHMLLFYQMTTKSILGYGTVLLFICRTWFVL
jgi:hypothetical protein